MKYQLNFYVDDTEEAFGIFIDYERPLHIGEDLTFNVAKESEADYYTGFRITEIEHDISKDVVNVYFNDAHTMLSSEKVAILEAIEQYNRSRE